MGKMKNIKNPIFAIDFEGSRKIGIVEYGIAEITNGTISACSTGICAPRTTISIADSKLFDITTTQAQAFPPFETHLQQFCHMRKRGVFMAHNAIAEDTMLRDALPASPIVENPLTKRNCSTWGPYIDSCVLAKTLFKLNSAKLSDVIDVFQLQNQLDEFAQQYCPTNRRKYHCALYDAIASALILIKICSFDGFEDVSLEWLLKYSNQSQDSQQALL
jgi:DNA polymerase-3 subunit epsilon